MPSCTSLRSVILCGLLALAGCRSESPESEAPASIPSQVTPGPAGKRVVVQVRGDGEPAIAEPDDGDKNWSAASYDKLVASRGDGRPTFSNNWFGANRQTWEKHLSFLAGTPDLRYLEVGVFEGQSFLWMFDKVLTHPGSRATAVDVFSMDGLEQRFRENLDRAGVADRVEIIKAYSNVALRPLEPNSYDVIYIDGSHTAANVLRDGILSWDLLKVGGILIFDDYALRRRFPLAIRPGPVIDAMITAFYKEAEVIEHGWQVMLRKRETGCHDSCSMIGPYYYHWNYKQPSQVGTGTLVDPRTSARVPITVEEGTVIETLLLSRPFGQVSFAPRDEFWQAPATQALMKRLNLL